MTEVLTVRDLREGKPQVYKPPIFSAACPKCGKRRRMNSWYDDSKTYSFWCQPCDWFEEVGSARQIRERIAAQVGSHI
jgi:Zn ribbon nucleic-acid-binding protein